MARKFGGTQAIRDLEPAVARPQSGYQLMFAEEATAWSGGLGEPSVRGWEREGGHRTLAPRARPGALTREPEATRLYFMVSLVGPKQTAGVRREAGRQWRLVRDNAGATAPALSLFGSS